MTARVLTNKYDDEEVGCDGRVTMKDFLSLANPEKMEVRYYRQRSCTPNTSVETEESDVNFFRELVERKHRENREAGIILREGDGPDVCLIVSNRAFEYDWKRYKSRSESAEDIAKEEMAIIKGSAVGDAKLAKTKEWRIKTLKIL